jgi:hypothetical protein
MRGRALRLGLWVFHAVFVRSFSDHLFVAFWMLGSYWEHPDAAVAHLRRCPPCRSAVDAMIEGLAKLKVKVEEAK